MLNTSKFYCLLTLATICFVSSSNGQALNVNCTWIFESCYLNFTNFECETKASWSRPDGTECQPPMTETGMPNAAKYCSPFPYCRTNAIFCDWSSWENPNFVTCGAESGIRTRKKDKCCHPITSAKMSGCFTKNTVEETKTVSWSPCETPANDGNSKTPMIVMLAVFLPVIVITIIVCFIHQFNKRINRPRAPQVTSPPQLQPAGHHNPMFAPGSGIVPEDLDLSQIDGQNNQTVPSAPPSYEETQRRTNRSDSLPPKYDVALNYVV